MPSDPYAGRTDVPGTIYLICMSRRYEHARHYLGWTGKDDVEERLGHHRAGNGSRLLRAAVQCGIELEVVRTWRGTRGDERVMHRRRSNVRYCPRCSERPWTPAGLKEVPVDDPRGEPEE